MSTTHNAGPGWDVEILDSEAVFVRYRGVDLVAVWLPVGHDSVASVTVPTVAEVAEAAEDVASNVQFGVAGETVVNLAGHIQAVRSWR